MKVKWLDLKVKPFALVSTWAALYLNLCGCGCPTLRTSGVVSIDFSVATDFYVPKIAPIGENPAVSQPKPTAIIEFYL